MTSSYTLLKTEMLLEKFNPKTVIILKIKKSLDPLIFCLKIIAPSFKSDLKSEIGTGMENVPVDQKIDFLPKCLRNCACDARF